MVSFWNCFSVSKGIVRIFLGSWGLFLVIFSMGFAGWLFFFGSVWLGIFRVVSLVFYGSLLMIEMGTKTYTFKILYHS